ncbi:MAG TPA: hypothetical protein DEQ30_04945 [Porphyromonadaceae bacterium]|nr:hypothetical protein [Porphyromonadaceae bacterium]
MILGFKTRYPEWMTKKGWETFFEDKINVGIKIHTIRKGHRFKPGDKIHAATGVRTKNYRCFKEMECVSVQNIELSPSGKFYPLMRIDNNFVYGDAFNMLIKNDGFDQMRDFAEWFNLKDELFIGQVIHWTDFSYSTEILSNMEGMLKEGDLVSVSGELTGYGELIGYITDINKKHELIIVQYTAESSIIANMDKGICGKAHFFRKLTIYK